MARSQRLLRACFLVVLLSRVGPRLFLPPPSATLPDVLERLEPSVQRKAAATAIQEEPQVIHEPPVIRKPPAKEEKPAAEKSEPAEDPEPAAEKSEQAEGPEPAAEKSEPAEDPEPAAEKSEPAEDPEPAAEKSEQAEDPEPAAEKSEPAEDPEPAAEKSEPEQPPRQEPEEELPEKKMLVEVESELEEAAEGYLADLKQEITEALRERNETSMVTILNHYGPSSEDAWLASLLMKALKDLLPVMFGDELGFLVMTMAYSEIRAVPIWHLLAEAAIEAALLETHPRCITEMAFGFAWVQWQQPDLFALLQVAMSSCVAAATDEQKKVFAWACARTGQPATKMFGKPSHKVEKAVAQKLWARFRGLSKRRGSEVKSLKKDPVPLLLMPEAVPMMHCDALIKLADSEKLWVDSSQVTSSEIAGELFVSSRNSATAVLAWHDSNPSVKAVTSWAAHALDVPENFIEPLQLVRYEEGQQVGSHMDWHDERDPGLWVFGQRMATVLVYLSNVPEGAGGETSFGSLGVAVRPQKGTALLWPNVNDIGAPEKRTIHSGRAIKGKQVKYALNIWIHGQKQPDRSWIKWHR